MGVLCTIQKFSLMCNVLYCGPISCSCQRVHARYHIIVKIKKIYMPPEGDGGWITMAGIGYRGWVEGCKSPVPTIADRSVM